MEKYIYGIISSITAIIIICICYGGLRFYVSNHYNDQQYITNPLQEKNNKHTNKNNLNIIIDSEKKDNAIDNIV
jgi:uncharacterized membrane protein (DUF373 family)